MRIGNAVGVYEAVDTEIPVGSIVAVEVAAVAIYLNTVFVGAYCLVDKVPDESALKRGIFSNKIPVLFESTLGVAHCVCVLTLYEWLWHGIFFGIFLHALVVVIHRAENIGESV